MKLFQVNTDARVAELADALDSGSSEGNFMGVQVPPLAPETEVRIHFVS